MQHDHFIGQVQHRARLGSRGDAERVTRATLETLGERIPEGLAGNLAAQLPHEIGEHLRRTVVMAGTGTGERVTRDAFLHRVAERAGMPLPTAAYGVRVVFEVVEEATSGALTSKVAHSLPDDLQQLLLAGSAGNPEHPGRHEQPGRGGDR